MFKIDNRKNRLKHKISFKSKMKPPEWNRKYKSIPVNTCSWFTTLPTTLSIYLYLVKIFFITLELNRCFRISTTIVEDNPNRNIHGILTINIYIYIYIHKYIYIYILIFTKFVFRHLGKVALIRIKVLALHPS